MEETRVPLPDYRAKRRHSSEYTYGIPVIDDSGARMLEKRKFLLKTGEYDVFVSSYEFIPSTLQIFSGKYDESGEKIYVFDV